MINTENMNETEKENMTTVISEVKKNADKIAYLRSRWEDEKEYEDGKAYKRDIIPMFTIRPEFTGRSPFVMKFRTSEIRHITVRFNRCSYNFTGFVSNVKAE